MKWTVMLVVTAVLAGRLEPLDDPPPHLPRYQNLTKAHRVHSDTHLNEYMEPILIYDFRRNKLLPVGGGTDRKLAFEDTLLVGVYDQYFIPVDQLSNAISLTDDFGESVNLTERLEINAPWLRAALHSDNYRFADVFDGMNEQMITVFSSSFALIGQMMSGLENVYVESNTTGHTAFHHRELFGQSCDIRNEHALNISTMIDKNVRTTSSFARVNYLKQQAQLRREFSEQKRHFQIVQKQLGRWNWQNDSTVSTSLRTKIKDFTQGTDGLLRQMNITLTSSFMVAQAEVQSAAQAFLLQTRPLLDTIRQFQPESWKECYTNFYAMNNLVKDTIVPAVEVFNIKMVGSMMGLRASIYEASITHYQSLEHQLALFSTITTVPFFDD